MQKYKYLTPQLFELIDNEIKQVLNAKSCDIEETLIQLKQTEDECITLIENGVQDMASHVNIDKSMPLSELTSRLKEINNIAKLQEKPDLSDLSLTFAAFLLTIDCDFLGYKFHTENILLECRALFENERYYLNLTSAIAEHNSKSGKSNISERYKDQDFLIKEIIQKWIDNQKPNIFEFNQQNFQTFYDLARRINAKIDSESIMHSKIEQWLEAFDKLINKKKAHKPRKIIQELAKKHLATAQ